MDPDFEQINHFIYSKINNYNKKFDEFKKNLDIQDNKITQICKDKTTKAIKKNPKKTAKQLIKLTELRESDDTSENEYELKKNSNEDIEKLIMKGGNFKGGMLDSLVDSEVEIIEEDEKIIYDNSNNSYKPLILGINVSIILYIISYLCLVYFEIPMDHLLIYTPLIIITEKIYPKALNKSV